MLKSLLAFGIFVLAISFVLEIDAAIKAASMDAKDHDFGVARPAKYPKRVSCKVKKCWNNYSCCSRKVCINGKCKKRKGSVSAISAANANAAKCNDETPVMDLNQCNDQCSSCPDSFCFQTSENMGACTSCFSVSDSNMAECDKQCNQYCGSAYSCQPTTQQTGTGSYILYRCQKKS